MATWDEAYRATPPWDIGRPQPALVEIARKGEMNPGKVLDVECGTGENAIFLAQSGFSVTGVFRLGNALALEFGGNEFDNVVDSGLCHTFSDDQRKVFARELARVIRVGGKYFMMCFSEKEPTGWGGPRRVSTAEINETFRPYFNINYIRDVMFATRIHSEGGKAYLTSATRLG